MVFGTTQVLMGSINWDALKTGWQPVCVCSVLDTWSLDTWLYSPANHRWEHGRVYPVSPNLSIHWVQGFCRECMVCTCHGVTSLVEMPTGGCLPCLWVATMCTLSSQLPIHIKTYQGTSSHLCQGRRTAHKRAQLSGILSFDTVTFLVLKTEHRVCVCANVHTRTCLFVCVHVCVHMQYDCTHKYIVHVEVRGQCRVSLITHHLLLWRQDLLLNPRLIISGRLSSQQAPGSMPCMDITDGCHHILVLGAHKRSQVLRLVQ